MVQSGSITEFGKKIETLGRDRNVFAKVYTDWRRYEDSHSQYVFVVGSIYATES